MRLALLFFLLLIPASNAIPFLAARAAMEPGGAIGDSTAEPLVEKDQKRLNESAVQDLKQLVSDAGGFMQSTASKIWALITFTGRESFHINTASIDPNLMKSANSPLTNETGDLEGLSRPDSYNQWLIINAPLAIWFIFILSIMVCVCCLCKCCC